ncbi:MAG: bifunctional tetrahydrofolate synthase/dihydrofolate synthase [Woeseia sp.]
MTAPRDRTSLDCWLSWLETLSPREIVLGLERVAEVLARLRLRAPERVIHVAGTNGKGSCAAMLEGFLLRGGYKVGCYTSPHLLRYNERIRINGIPADDGAIIAALETVESVRKGVPLTYFEFGTLAALVVFERERLESLVLEIGMGGRLDAVNAVEPDAAIVTNVALDHCDWLGSDVETIAGEKAGVMRPGKPLVFGSTQVPATIVSRAAELGADLRIAGRDFGFTEEPGNANRWSWRGRDTALQNLPRPSLSGAIQLHNASAVLALLESLHLDHLLTLDCATDALTGITLSGRFQWAGRDHRWLLDVAHNPHAARGLAGSLAALSPARFVVAVVGALGDKDVEGIVTALAPQVDRWIAVTADNPRAVPARVLAQSIANIGNKPCLVADEIGQAMNYASQFAGEDVLRLVTGSFYTVGPALDWLAAVDR